MDPEDVENFQRVEREVQRLAEIVERGDMRRGTVKFTVDMYTVVYSAATRCRIGDMDGQYAAAAALYARYEELLQEVVRRPLRDVNAGTPVAGESAPVLSTSNASAEQVFHAMVSKWSQFQVVRSWMAKSFKYLSRFYIVHCNQRPLDVVALSVFFELFKDHTVNTGKHLLALFTAERRGEIVNKDDIRLAVELFNSMAEIGNGDELLMRDFTGPFLRQTRSFYTAEAAQWIAEGSAPDFLQRADRAIREEQDRAHRLLPPSMQQVLVLNVEQQVLANHLHHLIDMPNTGFAAMLRDWRTEQMGQAVALLSRLKQAGLDPLAKVIERHCAEECAAIAKRYSSGTSKPAAAEPAATSEGGPVDFKGYTSDFMDLHDKYTQLLSEHLQGHSSFQNAVKDAFESKLNDGILVNGERVSCAELITSYCDQLMRQGADRMSDDELEAVFGRIVSLFLRVVDRDVFGEFLRKHLSRRLLTAPNFNDETEKSLIQKFKAKCGASFTSKLEGMINDRSTSAETSKDFLDSAVAREADCGFDFSVQVLTMGFWPTMTVDRAALPPLVKLMADKFSDFFLARGKNKKLEWVHSHGSAVITATFKRGTKEFTMAVYQGIVLMLFNETADTPLTLQQIAERSCLEMDEVKRVVVSFCHSKVKVLVRDDAGTGPMGPSDSVRVNVDFSSAQKKMKLPLAIQRVAQAAAVQQTVTEDRKPAIDACIVRVMKSRKELEHASLVAAVIDVLQSRFKPDPKLIKLRIEDLINREYLERKADKPNTYVYLA